MRLHDVSKGTEGKVISDDELKDLQRVLLMILKDLSKICEENGLQFIIIGGTAIGGIRHNGFIPWDDDIDIAMTRHDYKLLADIIRNQYGDKYSVSDADDKENYGRIIPKIRLKGTVYRTVLESDLEDCGIRTDIFLIENVFDNKVLMTVQGTLSMFFGFALSCRRLYLRRNDFKDIAKGYSFKIKKALGLLFSFASIEKWAKWTDDVYSMCKNDESEFISVPTDGGHFFGELTKRNSLCSTVPVQFENIVLRIPASYDQYLTRIYGDYMKIPPKEKQIRNQILEYDLGEYK